MDLTIHTSSNENLMLQPGLPPGVTALTFPGSNAWSAEGDFGTIMYEEYQTGSFTLRFTFFKLLKKMTLHCRMQSPLTGARVALQNKWRFSMPGSSAVKLLENQFVLYSPGKNGEKIVFEKDKEYRSFDALCPPEKLASLLELFPAISSFVQDAVAGKSSFVQKKPLRAPHDALDIIKELPECPFEGLLKKYYAENQMDELLFLLLVLALRDEPEEQAPTQKEVDAAHEAEKLILADITLHHSIPAIARKVNLNEFRLKYVFKYIFETGIFEYLLNARMQEAKRLLVTTDKPIKEIASLTGYQRLTSFITAFRKHFRYTPGSVRRTT